MCQRLGPKIHDEIPEIDRKGKLAARRRESKAEFESARVQKVTEGVENFSLKPNN